MGTLIGFGVGAFLICFVAVCYSYMIKYAPVAGGAFAYAYVGFGPTAAFVCGWALVLGYIAIIGIDVAALALIFRFLFPGVLSNSFAGKLQVMLAFLLTIGIVALFTGSASLETAQLGNLLPLFAEHRSELSCVLIIFAISPFLFVGFDTVPQAAEEFTFDP
ncbi:APC family permease, partial [Aduncisulcus paluster]